MNRARPVPAAAVLGLVVATLFWAGNYVVGAFAVESLSPIELTYWRWVIAVVPLLVIAQVMEHPDWAAVWRQ